MNHIRLWIVLSWSHWVCLSRFSFGAPYPAAAYPLSDSTFLLSDMAPFDLALANCWMRACTGFCRSSGVHCLRWYFSTRSLAGVHRNYKVFGCHLQTVGEMQCHRLGGLQPDGTVWLLGPVVSSSEVLNWCLGSPLMDRLGLSGCIPGFGFRCWNGLGHLSNWLSLPGQT